MEDKPEIRRLKIVPVISLPELLESGVHFGHQARRWNPKMRPYIFTERNGIHIIDLVQTAQLMEGAYEYIRNAANKGKKFLFVGTKRQAAGLIEHEAIRCGAYYINQRWLGGLLTNWTTIKTRVERLKELERMEENGALALRPKKEASVLRRELFKLRKYLGGIKTMRKIPDIAIVVDQRREYNAVQECIKLDIPIVAMLDTNCDPDLADIPIPGNDDAIRSIRLILSKLADAIYEGYHGALDSTAEQAFADYSSYEESNFEDEDEDAFEAAEPTNGEVESFVGDDANGEEESDAELAATPDANLDGGEADGGENEE